MRVNRAYNTGSTDLAGVVYLHTDDVDAAVADGIPDIPSTQVRTIINAAENQTLQAAYTIPDGRAGFLKQWCVSALTTSGTTNALTARLRLTRQGGVGRVQSRMAISNPGTFCHEMDPPSSYQERDALEVTVVSTGAASNVDAAAMFDLMLSLMD
jgi:hypothetical protein